MPMVIVFLEEGRELNNLSEIHVFETDQEALEFSSSLVMDEPFRRHLVKRIPDKCWHFDMSPLGGRSYAPSPHEVQETGA